MVEIKNHTEIAVQQALNDYLRNHELSCSCEYCIANIKALVLNRLPALYYVSLRGEIMTRWKTQTLPDQVRILSEVVQAAQMVSAAPLHPLENSSASE